MINLNDLWFFDTSLHLQAWRQPDGCLMTTWWLPGDSLMTAWWLLDDSLMTARLLPDYCLMKSQQQLNDCQTTVRSMPGNFISKVHIQLLWLINESYESLWHYPFSLSSRIFEAHYLKMLKVLKGPLFKTHKVHCLILDNKFIYNLWIKSKYIMQ